MFVPPEAFFLKIFLISFVLCHRPVMDSGGTLCFLGVFPVFAVARSSSMRDDITFVPFYGTDRRRS